MPDSAWTYQVALLAALVTITVPFAYRNGGRPERAIAAGMLAMAAVDILLFLYPAPLFTGLKPETIRAFRDTALLIWLGAIALRANRLYPLVMAGAALIAVLAQLLYWTDWLDGRLAYLALTATPWFVALVAFWLGLIGHRRRIKNGAECPDWQDSVPGQTLA